MTSGMPELGSKISLISKADIRYEGRLYTVDPQECTIALSSVRSFGTEDRDTQYKIEPQSQIYDYILFRGSDIKDIRVVNNSLPHPNDPAIVQMHLPNGQHLMPHFPMPNMGASHSGGMGGGAFGNPFGTMGGLGSMGNGASTSAAAAAAASLAPGAGAPGSSGQYMMNSNQQQQSQQQQNMQQHKPQAVQQQKQPNMLAGASRSTTPISLISRKSPSAELGMQQMQQQQQHHNQHNQNQVNAGHGGNMRDAGHKRPNHQQQQQQRGGGGGGNRNNNNNDYYQQQQHRGGDGRMDNYNQYDGRNNYNNPRNQNHQNHQNQNRNWTMHRGGPNNNMNNNMNMRNRGPGGRGRMQNQNFLQGFRQMGGLPANQNKPRSKNTIKFEQDFDFEQANNKFEELRLQLSKLKVGDDPKAEQLTNETDKKDDSGNETGAGEHEHEEEEITVGYDKTKSFFDNISCEAAQDRSKSKKNDWRQERKLNSETFGVSSTRRGTYRGRPNYYNNRNMNNYMGAGYNRNYRGGNFRNRSNNRINNMTNNRDNSNSNTNGTNGTSTGTPVVPKTQAQQPTSNADSATPTPPAATKVTPLQETIASPHIAAVGPGQ